MKYLIDELKGSINFFLNLSNLNPASPGYGLCADSTRNRSIASIASTGYALTAWVIAVERGYLDYQKACEMTRRTLHTLNFNVSHEQGFFAHFIYIETGKRYKKSEYSTIDTAICLNGVITAAEYFQDEAIQKLAQQLLDRVDWNYIIFEKGNKMLFRMAYNPDVEGDYVTGNPGFISQWDMAAEQKMMYFQAAATKVDPAHAERLYQGFSRDIGAYHGDEFIINPPGSLYAYQCSEAWFDFGKYLDSGGIDWFHNLRLAALANRDFCLDHSKDYRTYHARSWGLSSGDSPYGYAVFGGGPCLGSPKHNGTVSIWGALACLPAIPELTIEMAEYLLQDHPQTWGEYGFFDAYNLDVTPAWYSHQLYGIDKGCSMIMIENYLSGLIWDIYTNSSMIQKALGILGYKKKGKAG